MDETRQVLSGQTVGVGLQGGASSASEGSAGPGAALLGGRFEVEKPIGEGGMGQVFLVRDRQIENRQVALKLIRDQFSREPKFRSAFFKEIGSAQQFVSEHAVQIRDCGELPGGQLFLTMDFVEGESLSELLKREKSLMPRHALEIARQVLIGLSSGHEKGYVHRDVKPGNVMLAARVPKTGDNPHGVKVGLLDFGIAGLDSDLKGGKGPGTPFYMSPEQVQGQPLDSRSDLFAVGVMLFEMISGTRPFDGRTVDEITTAVLDTETTPLVQQLDGLKKPVKKVLRKALQKKREKRYASAAEFIRAIEGCTTFQAREGGPGWVGGLAALTTTASLALGFLLVDARNSKGLGQVEKNQEVVDLKRQLTTANSANTNLQTKNTNLGADLDAEKRRVGDLESKNGLLEQRIKGAESAKTEAERRSNSASSEANKRVLETNAQVQALVVLIERVVGFISVDWDRQARRRRELAEAFDDLVANITQGQGGLTGRGPIEVLKEDGFAVESVPGLKFLADLENLAARLGRLTASADGGPDVTSAVFTEVNALSAGLRGLTGSGRVERFLSDCSEKPDQGSRYMYGDQQYTGGWLAFKPRSNRERIEKIVADVHRRPPVDSGAKAADPSATGPTSGGQGGPGTRDSGEEEGVRVASAFEDDPPLANAVGAIEALMSQKGDEGMRDLWRALYDVEYDEEKLVERRESLTVAIAAMEALLREERQALEEAAAEEATRLADLPASDSEQRREKIGQIRTFFERFGSEAVPHIGGFLPAFTKGLEDVLLNAGGDVHLAGVEELPPELKELEDSLEELEDSLKWLPGGQAEELAKQVDAVRWLVLAQQWWCDRRLDVAEPEFVQKHELKDAEAAWRDLLTFQIRAEEGWKKLKEKESRWIYHSRPRGASGGTRELEWTVFEVVENGEGASAPYELKKAIFGETGQPRESPFTTADLEDAAIQWEGDTVVMTFHQIPEAFEFERADLGAQRKSFDDRVKRGQLFRWGRGERLSRKSGGAGAICLRLLSGSGEGGFLLHPELGIVSHESKSKEHVLVHLDQ